LARVKASITSCLMPCSDISPERLVSVVVRRIIRYAAADANCLLQNVVLRLTTVTGRLRSDSFTSTKDTASEPVSDAAATSSAAQGAERGEGCAMKLAKRSHSADMRSKNAAFTTYKKSAGINFVIFPRSVVRSAAHEERTRSNCHRRNCTSLSPAERKHRSAHRAWTRHKT
jgi:hypothetical protein